MKNKFKVILLAVLLMLSSGCFSILIKKDNSAEDAYRAQVKQQDEDAQTKYTMANEVLAAGGLKKAVEFCQQISNLYQQRSCYSEIFKANKDKNVCKGLNGNTVAHYTCYTQLLKEQKLLAAEIKKYCPDKMCLSAYAYRHYGIEGSLPDFQNYRDEARKIESETAYHRQAQAIVYPSRGLEFHEVLHAEARTNRAIGIGYDLNFKYNGSELPSLGVGYYNLLENIYFVDVVVSGVQKPVAARLALGAEFKDNYDTRFHILYALGLSVKSAGIAPLIEISSDFKKDHQLVLGLMFLFQPAR